MTYEADTEYFPDHNEYNFAGELLFSKHAHLGHPDYGTGEGETFGPYERSATLYKSYTYDARGRLLRTEQKTEDQENEGHETEFVTLSEQRYDKLGQMSTKNLHYKAGDQFLQLGDYQYNIRGWLSKFNNPSTSVPGGSYRDLLAFELHYNSGATGIVSGTTHQYNGNISAMQWQVLGEGKEVRAYAFSYDKMNRLTQALYREKTSSAWNVNTGRYDVKDLTYDKNGNIKTLKRYGKTGTSSYGLMDNLSYVYKNTGNSNQLGRVTDSGLATGLSGVEQFVDGNTSGDDYSYDASGNLERDLNKDITDISYNHLNKPTEVEFFTGLKKITYIYDAAGTKLRQKVFNLGGTSSTKETDYIGPFHYEDSDGDGTSESPEMLFFSHEEGRVRRAGEELVYETFLKDHLGNVRVMFTDANGDGWVDPADDDEVLQVDHYYPFGLRMAGLSTAPGVPNFYTFTGKEYQDELGLGWVDFGARMLDPATGRWNGVDALAEKYLAISPFAYVANNPLIFVDPNGEEIDVSFLLYRHKEGKLNQDNVYKLFSMMLDLSEITGMELKVENSEGRWLINESGDVASNGGSGKARDYMRHLMSEDAGTIRVESWSSTFANAPGNLVYLGPEIDNQIYSTKMAGLGELTFGYGMTFLHESLHTKVGGSFYNKPGGLADATEEEAQTYMFAKGETVDKVNEFRTELGLPLRQSHAWTRGTMQFSKPGAVVPKYGDNTITVQQRVMPASERTTRMVKVISQGLSRALIQN